MDLRALVQGLYGNNVTDVPKGGVSSYPKNEVDHRSIVGTILQGMQRPKRPNGDVPQGQPVMSAMGDTVTRTTPTGTVLSYDVLKRHPNGDLTVRIISPDGYPIARPFTAPGHIFDDKK